VAVLISGLTGVAVHSAGYVRLERDQGPPHLRQPTSPASPGPSLRASAAQEAIAGAGISTRSAYAYQRTSQSEQNQCMGRSTSLRVAAWDAASRPHDQHKAKHRQGRTGPAFLALPIPLHDPGTSTRPPSCAFATLRTGGWPPPRVGSSAATHPTGVTRVTYHWTVSPSVVPASSDAGCWPCRSMPAVALDWLSVDWPIRQIRYRRGTATAPPARPAVGNAC
jgi:hypothetical protein